MEENKVSDLVKKVSGKFPTFGGGKEILGKPIATITKSDPPKFVGNVDVEEVVRFILEESGK